MRSYDFFVLYTSFESILNYWIKHQINGAQVFELVGCFYVFDELQIILTRRDSATDGWLGSMRPISWSSDSSAVSVAAIACVVVVTMS